MYNQQVLRGCVGEKTQFDYSICLVRSHYQEDMKKGVALLEDLLRREKDDAPNTDYLFYIAVGYTRLKDYQQALKYVSAVTHLEPRHQHARRLHAHITKKMETDGLMGIAIVGGAAVVVGGLIGLGIAALKK
ncbi:mitochondrial fission 1 protein-like isoform X2 [Babylonia areolata]